jgi:hypothetical protein
MDISYFDDAGAYRTYSGSEESFDWGQVGTLVAVDWRCGEPELR